LNREVEGGPAQVLLELIAQATSLFPDKGQVTLGFYGLYPHAHRGKMKNHGAADLRMKRAKIRPLSLKSRAVLIRKPRSGRRNAG
jgi:hypothetical protein